MDSVAPKVRALLDGEVVYGPISFHDRDIHVGNEVSTGEEGEQNVLQETSTQIIQMQI